MVCRQLEVVNTYCMWSLMEISFLWMDYLQSHVKVALMKSTILLTGASRGIGAYIAKTLCRSGYRVLGVARNEQKLEAIQHEVGSEFIPIPLDLLQHDAPKQLIALCSQYAPLTGVVHNAGIEHYEHFSKTTAKNNHDILYLNLYTPIEITRLLLQSGVRGAHFHVINIASLAGKKGVAYNSIYSASKGGLLLWADSLQQEYRGSNLHISSICPGFVRDAGMAHDTGVAVPAAIRSSSPQDVADAVLANIRKPHKEFIVNPGPMRLLLTIGQLFPAFSDWLMDRLGIKKANFCKIHSV